MIAARKISKSILGEPLFEEVSFVINRGDRVGFVGPNGSGKSTILKMIIGRDIPEKGQIIVEKENIGYLPQEPEFADIDIAEYARESGEIIKEAGLSHLSSKTLIKDLSGGQKTRLSLARIFTEKPTMLLLDEPTNHLDVDGIEWLEGKIKSFRGGVIAVSHDRKFLDNIADRIMEIDPGSVGFAEYAGGYTEYAREKEKGAERLLKEYEAAEKERRRLELWLALKRQEAALYDDPAKGKRIKAVQRKLERDFYSKDIKKPMAAKKLAEHDLSGGADRAKLVIRGKRIAKSFSGKMVIKDASFEIRGNDKILLSGRNGSGKTTLIKIIGGIIQPDRGELKIGNGIRTGYFSQEQETLDRTRTVMSEFLSGDRLQIGSRDPRSILGSFLFSGEAQKKSVSDLSFGEKVRLMFAKLMNEENDLLLLDEPTNHLDIPSREAIEKSIMGYEGAIVLVSHDRYFVEKLAIDRTFLIEEGTLKEIIAEADFKDPWIKEEEPEKYWYEE